METLIEGFCWVVGGALVFGFLFTAYVIHEDDMWEQEQEFKNNIAEKLVKEYQQSQGN